MGKPMKWVLFALVIVALVWMRGSGLALVVGGHYPISSFAVDLLGFAVLLLLLGLLSRGIRQANQRLFQSRVWLQQVVYPLAMIIVAFPMLLVTIQLHPPRVAGSTSNTPAKLGLNYQNVVFQADGLKLAGWFIPAEKANQPIVLVTHGLGADKADFLFVAKPLHEAGLNIFTFDFRAHGESEGRTITFGLNEAYDVKAAHEWLTQHYPGQPIYGLGFSMGGASLARAAGDYGIFDRLVLDSSFARFENVVRAKRLKLFGPLSPLLWQLSRGWAALWTQRDFSDNDPARSLASRTSSRLMLIHGTADSTTPVSEAEKLHAATAAFSTLWLIEGSEHAQGHHQPDYMPRLREFFLAP